MNKKLMVVAVAGALSAPSVVLAQASNVQMYGLFQTAYENGSATGATATGSAFATAGQTHPTLAGAWGASAGAALTPGATGNSFVGRNRIQNYSTRFGVRGTEDLGNGLSAVFQLESGVSAEQPAAVLTGGQVLNGALATRDTWVGLSSKSWGTVQLGYQDVPFVTMHYPIDYWVGFSNGLSTNILGSNALAISSTGIQPSGTTSLSSAMAFQRREGNTIMWRSPNWSGFAMQLMYAANEAKAAGSVTGGMGVSRAADPNLWSGQFTYNNGPLYLGYGFQRMKDYSLNVFGTVGVAGAAQVFAPATGQTSSTDTGNKIVAQYKFGNTQVGMIWEKLKWEGSGFTGVSSLSRLETTHWALSVGHQLGNAHLRAQYARANDGSCGTNGTAPVACSANDMGASMWSLGAMYDLSKRTQLFGYWSQVNNKQYAAYGQAMAPGFGAVAGATTATGVGADPRVISLGIRHAF